MNGEPDARKPARPVRRGTDEKGLPRSTSSAVYPTIFATEALRLVTDVPVVASSERKIACGAGSAGSLCAESETVCGEAGTKVL